MRNGECGEHDRPLEVDRDLVRSGLEFPRRDVERGFIDFTRAP